MIRVFKKFKVCKSVHHRKFQINQPTRCNNSSRLLLDIYWNILTMHGPINVKSPNNSSRWAFKGLTWDLWWTEWRCDRFLLVSVIPPVLHDANHSRCTNIRRLTTGIRSEKCVVRRFRRSTNVYLHKPNLLHT
jgi:hypothetical protein